MSASERQAKLIKLAATLFPGELITNQYSFKGTTIERLCESDGGPYQRVLKWLEKKVSEMPKEEEVSEEMLEMKKGYKQAYELMCSRNKKYGDSWKVLSLQSMANLIEMKMHRVANMATKDLDPKIEDEFIDSINYAAMALYKFNKEK